MLFIESIFLRVKRNRTVSISSSNKTIISHKKNNKVIDNVSNSLFKQSLLRVNVLKFKKTALKIIVNGPYEKSNRKIDPFSHEMNDFFNTRTRQRWIDRTNYKKIIHRTSACNVINRSIDFLFHKLQKSSVFRCSTSSEIVK